MLGVFLSADPVTAYSDPMGMFNRYRYANSNLYKFTDPDGRQAVLEWTAYNRLTLMMVFRRDESQATSSVSNADISSGFRSNFSGTVNVNGIDVRVQAMAVNDPNASLTLTVVPTTAGVTQSGRPETNRMSGDNITIDIATSLDEIVHELGHPAGAGDQYVGGVSSESFRVLIPGPGKNMMQDLLGPAFDQSMREIIGSPANTNRCAEGVSAASGAC